ncbi:MAG: SiaB family protein kinase [Bacteroidetes bacterium]|nr:SiaB family protein kinase [Bacteroidota bacterium]
MDIFDIYDKMERNNILLSFKGEVTSDLLTSILQIMENKMEDMQEDVKTRKKVYNVLVECLQNLYHHMDEISETEDEKVRSAIFTIGKMDDKYTIITGNYIGNENIQGLKKRIDDVNALTKDELKDYYKRILNNGEMSLKGGGGLGMIDIARKTGEKLEYNFLEIDKKVSFFTLNIKISNQN